ncbi:MAG: hypothetical protein K2M17_04635 [Bacilli bacterium]|nr:hypothetical protein [Bacilli bacterium]
MNWFLFLTWTGLIFCTIGAIIDFIEEKYFWGVLMLALAVWDIISLCDYYTKEDEPPTKVENVINNTDNDETTMEIIKPGNINKVVGHRKYEGICPDCDCEFIFEDKDVTSDQKERDSWVHCPTCGHVISMTSTNVKQKL